MARKSVKVEVELTGELLAVLNKFAEDIANHLFFINGELLKQGSDQAESVGALMGRCLQFKEDLLQAHSQPVEESEASE